MENSGINVLVNIPAMGAMHPTLVATLIRWVQAYPSDQLSFYFSYNISPVDRAPNDIAKFFLDDKSHYTHLLFTNSDTIPPADALSRLTAAAPHRAVLL